MGVLYAGGNIGEKVNAVYNMAEVDAQLLAEGLLAGQ